MLGGTNHQILDCGIGNVFGEAFNNIVVLQNNIKALYLMQNNQVYINYKERRNDRDGWQ